jgi:ubiquitin C-terminal hydrolase
VLLAKSKCIIIITNKVTRKLNRALYSDNQYQCKHCQCKTDAIRTLRLSQLPLQYLQIHLNRAAYQLSQGGLQDERHVASNFQIELLFSNQMK